MNAAYDSTTPPIPIILRRNPTVTTTASPPPPPPPPPPPSSSMDFELVSINPTCYTSLRDILPSPATVVNSPKSPHSTADSSHEILIRNHLVKQAAWAYLRPMSTTPDSGDSDGSAVLRRLWSQFSGTLLRLITTVFNCLLPSVHI